MQEIWKPIPGYKNYYKVSNLGNVISLRTNKKMKGSLSRRGYHSVVLSVNTFEKTFFTHQLVAMAFLGHKLNGMKLVVDHINNDKLDNRVENLQIVTQRENSYRLQGTYSSKYKGVCWFASRKKWISRIHINGKTHHLGYFTNELEASEAYKNKLKTL